MEANICKYIAYYDTTCILWDVVVCTTWIKVIIYYAQYILNLSPILLQLQFSLSVYPPDHSSSQDAMRPFPWPRGVLESPNPNEPGNAETGNVSDRAGVSKTSSVVLAEGRSDVDLRQLESFEKNQLTHRD